jgi:hypothetical protein
MLEAPRVRLPVEPVGVSVERAPGPVGIRRPSRVALKEILVEAGIGPPAARLVLPPPALDREARPLVHLESMPLGMGAFDTRALPVEGREPSHRDRPGLEDFTDVPFAPAGDREALQRFPSRVGVLELLDVATRAVTPHAARGPMPVGTTMKQADETTPGTEDQMHPWACIVMWKIEIDGMV